MLRYFNVFGPRQSPHSEYAAVVPLFITAIAAGEPVTIYGDGEQSRDFTYVENVVDATAAAAAPASADGSSTSPPAAGERERVRRHDRAAARQARRARRSARRAGDIRDSWADVPRRAPRSAGSRRSGSRRACARTVESLGV